MPRRATVCLMLASLALAPIACGQNSNPAPEPVTRTATPDKPSPDAASPDDIAFAKRLSNAFKSVAHNVEPSVVHVTQRNRVITRSDWFGRPVRSGVVDTGLGSGFIVSREGHIVTNNHVISSGQKAADELKVKLFNGREVPAQLVGRDELTDLAVLKIDPKEIPSGATPVTFGDSDALDVGEWVVAIGSPFGLNNTVTAGIVSAKGRSISPKETGRVQDDFIQTDAAINPGNSGGPLLNLQGEVVGINSAIASRSGGYQGIGFAIPSNIANAVMNNIITHGKVVRGWLGVELTDASSDTSANRGGVLVKSVEDESPASKAGLQNGDVITKFQGRAVNEVRLRQAIALTAPGTNVPLEVLRDGEPKTVQVTLGDQTTALGLTDVPQLGARVRTVPKDAAIGRTKISGIVVVEVDPEGRAATNDLQEGDVIVSYRQGNAERAITSADQFKKLASAANYANGIQLNVIRTQSGFIQKGYIIIQD